MPIPYAERRLRRQKLLDALPANLQGRIALRNAEAVSKLDHQAQEVLASALEAGVKISAALQYLQEHPDPRLSDLGQLLGRPIPNPKEHHRNPEHPNEGVLLELSQLLQFCYPDMPKVTADAMAGSQLLSGILGVLKAQRECFASQFGQTDFVVVVLCGLVLRNIEQLNQIVASKRIYQEALRQSGVNWPIESQSQAVSN